MYKQVIVFGALPIATKICEFLETIEGVQYKVVLGNKNPHNNDPWTDTPLLKDYAKLHGIDCLDLENLPVLYRENELTLGLCCRYGVILKSNVINLFKYGIINMHGGLIPEFRGLNSSCHCIIEGSEMGGGSLHYIDEGIDTGQIIRRCEFPITAEDTGYTVFQKTQLALYENLIRIIPKALNGKVDTVTRQDLINDGHIDHYFKKHDIEKFKELRLEDIGTPFADKVIRAFDFPMHEPAYLKINGKKIFLKFSYV